MTLKAAEQFGRYQLLSRMGRGGMAETYRSRLLGAAGVTREVLIKKVLPEYANSPDFTTMFIREGRISASLSHSNIAQVYDFGCVDGEYFLAMEYVDGQPLNRILKRAQHSGLSSLPMPLALLIISEVCRGLHYAHTRVDEHGQSLEIVHRDISPDNVIVSYEGQVKIVDFGIAKAREPEGSATEPGVVKGKFLYFAPEQARGEQVDARADVWATGVVLYKLLCGRLPVEGPGYLVVPRIASGEFPRPRAVNPELPLELDAIVMRALAVKREQRYESCQALGAALTEALSSLAPRLSTQALAYFMQTLFAEELRSDGRHVQVPASFQEEMTQWSGGTAPAHSLPPQPVPEVPTDVSAEPAWMMPPASRRGPLLMVGLGSAVLGAVLAFCLTATLGSASSQPSDAPPPKPLVIKAAEAEHRKAAPAPTALPAVVPSSGAVLTQAVVPAVVQAPKTVPAAAVPSHQPVVDPEPDSDEAQVLYARAAKALQRREWKWAVSWGEKCIKADERLVDCYLAAGEGYARQQKDQGAINLYATFLKLVPASHPRAEETRQALKALQGKRSYAEGSGLFRDGQFRQALDNAHRCMEQDSENANCQLLAGDSLIAMGYQDKGVEHYRRFMDMAPEHAAVPRVRTFLEGYERHASRER